MDTKKLIEQFRTDRAWLYTLIQDPKGERYFLPKDREQGQRNLVEQYERMQRFMAFAGNPEAQFPAVHISGTSGKGSVTMLISALLTACGQRTADHISPYLQLSTEKLRVDGQMIAPSEFSALIQSFQQLYERWIAQGEFLKYGEAWVSLTYLWFALKELDWGIVETGVGGRFDPTNVTPAKMAVITNVDYDHVHTLGNTLESIASHKAGIIKEGGLAITSATKPEVLEVITAEALTKNAHLQILQGGRDGDPSYHLTEDGILSVTTPFHQFDGLDVPLDGYYQKLNSALAISAVSWLSNEYDFPITQEMIQAGLNAVHYIGRFETMQTDPLILIDGAHNPHKVETLVKSIQQKYPDQKFTVQVGVIVSKSAEGILKALLPIAKKFIVSEPNVFGKPPQEAEQLATQLAEYAPEIPVVIHKDVQDGIDAFLSESTDVDMLLITGSIYLIGEARDRWHPQDEILEACEKRA